jgi:class 3 adenylate cyclase/TolB-like protein
MTPSPASCHPIRSLPRAHQAVLVADLAESVRIMHLDEAGVVDRWSRFVHEVQQQVLLPRGGRLVKSLGDGFLAVFPSAPSAAAAADDLHARIAAFNHGHPPDLAMRLRIGLHQGSVYVDALDVYGDAVNLTARLATLAAPGESVVSADFREGLVDGVDATVEDLGDCFLKHMPEPVRAYRLGPPASTPLLDTVHERESRRLRPAIAVLPFEPTLGGDPDAPTGDALADEVITHLARTAEMDVISGLSTRALRGRQLTVDDVARHVGAAYVLSGRYRLAADRVRLNVELVDTHGRHIVWADGFSGRLSELLHADGGMAPAIVREVARAILTREIDKATSQPLPTVESYALLFGAIALMHRATRDDFVRARAMLDELAHRHGRNAIAHAWMAKWHVLRAVQGWSPDAQTENQQALQCTQRALDAHPGNALALSITGLVHGYLRKDLKTAGEWYRAAREANPHEPMAWLFSSTWHAYHGEGDQAAQAAATALRLSPLDPLKYFFDSLAATALLASGQWARSVDLSRRSIRANRTHASTWRTLIYGAMMLGDEDTARAGVAELLAIEPTYTVSAFRQRFPGRDGPMAEPWAQALKAAGLPA